MAMSMSKQLVIGILILAIMYLGVYALGVNYTEHNKGTHTVLQGQMR
jgi:uncharacterized membrane protein